MAKSIPWQRIDPNDWSFSCFTMNPIPDALDYCPKRIVESIDFPRFDCPVRTKLASVKPDYSRYGNPNTHPV
jgi:hypothetical protein